MGIPELFVWIQMAMAVGHLITAITRKTKREQRAKPDGSTKIICESPSKYYKPLYQLQYGDSELITVAEKTPFSREKTRRGDCSSLSVVQKLLGPNIISKIESIQQVQHPHFVRAREIFCCEDTFVFYEFMPLSLAELAGNSLIDELRLASIIGQVGCRAVHLDKANR